ncbi:MAG: FG-GAP-like repeat-containing protein [Nocardioides marinisabuli]|uniref:FG-GAP-like repeat-containing protein n=1 Tax=Nocardioides marinisabuli TaxID=419476 RepID=UPI00321A6583
MPPSRSRFVSGCQQLLVLGATVAVLAPAASVITLEVVQQPGAATAPGYDGALAAYVRSAQKTATVPTGPVEAVVEEHVLTAPGGEATTSARALAQERATVLTSRPEPVTGYGAVGVTWEPGADLDEDDIAFEVRTRTDGVWSEWAELEYHDEHAPDPTTEEGASARPGTEPMMVGEVDDVQVRSTERAGALPGDMRMAVIDPGTPEATAQERAALDTATLDGADGTGSVTALEVPAQAGEDTDVLTLQSAEVTPKPVIYSREQWGADERLRSGSPSYHEVHAGFVHHTVNANDYTKDQVPAMLRSIYAYHTKSRGWSDVGYNYLVDRFGRIWEGRAGGIDRPVVGAHTLGYNEYSFAMSAIGNFEQVRPSEAVVQAYGALFAWKLSLHGVDAASGSQRVGSRSFPAVNGHRDAGSTACPGAYLYQRLGDIRALADAAQADFSGRQLPADLVDTPHPDLLARRASDGRVFVIPTGGLSRVRKPSAVSTGWSGYDSVLLSDDVTGDGLPDALGVTASGAVDVRPGREDGFGETTRTATATEGHDLVTAVGDVDGDGLADLVGRDGDRLEILSSRGDGRFRAASSTTGWAGYDALAGSDLDGDGYADLVARRADGTMLWHRGSASGFGAAQPLAGAGSGSGWDVVSGLGDWNGDGHADLFVRRTGGHGYVLPGRGDGSVGHPLGPIKRLKGRPGLTGGADLSGDGVPDLVFLKGETLMRIVGTGKVETRAPVDTGARIRSVDLLLNVGDWDGDGFGDLVLRKQRNGVLKMRPGDGAGSFGKAVRLGRAMSDVRLLEAVGDVTGDGWPDLMGQPVGGSMMIYPGRGAAALGTPYVAHSAISASRQVGVGLWDRDGAPDSMFRQGDALVAYPGNGPGGLTDAARVDLDLRGYDVVTGIGDANLKTRADLVVRESATGYLWLLEGKASGFKSRRFLADGAGVYDLVD